MMPDQPSANAILEAYTLDQLIELAKEKAQMDLQQQLSETRNLLDTFSQTMGGAFPTSIQSRSKGVGNSLKRSGIMARKEKRSSNSKQINEKHSKRAKGSEPAIDKESKSAKKVSEKKVSEKKMSLGAHLGQILGLQPMNIESILTELDQRGHVSKSKDPRRVLYLELKKQINKGNVAKSSRGMYSKA